MKNRPTARKILKKAMENATVSMRYFDWYNEETEDVELKNSYWTSCIVHDGRAAAYLDCYEMLTGREVVNIQAAIKEEYESMFMY